MATVPGWSTCVGGVRVICVSGMPKGDSSFQALLGSWLRPTDWFNIVVLSQLKSGQVRVMTEHAPTGEACGNGLKTVVPLLQETN